MKLYDSDMNFLIRVGESSRIYSAGNVNFLIDNLSRVSSLSSAWHLIICLFIHGKPYKFVRACQVRIRSSGETWTSVLAGFQRHRCYRIYIVRSSPSCITLFGVLHYFLTTELRRPFGRDEIGRNNRVSVAENKSLSAGKRRRWHNSGRIYIYRYISTRLV